jgi:hypothetical protein
MTGSGDPRRIQPPPNGGRLTFYLGQLIKMAFISSTRSRQKNGAPGASARSPPTRELACVGWITAKPRPYLCYT